MSVQGSLNQVKSNTQPLQLASAKTPGDHPFAEVVEAYLREGGVNPDKIVEEDENHIRWCFHLPEEMVADFSLYKTAEHEVFIWLEVGLGRTTPENEAEIAVHLMKCQGDYFFPMRTALTTSGVVIVQFRCYAEGITKEHMEWRTKSMLQFASEVRQDLARNFGLAPLTKRSKQNEA